MPIAPSTGPAPLLDEISRETQNLFQSVRPGLVRVELPPPKLIDPLNDANNPLQKWMGNLDPAVKKLLEEQSRAAAGHDPGVSAFVTTQPATAPASDADASPAANQPPTAPTASPGSTRTFLVQRPDGGYEFITTGAPSYDAMIAHMAGPQFLGIVLDDAGHVLIPIFVQKEALDGRPLKVFDSQGNLIEARFIGSDRQTNLTVIQLKIPIGTPLKIEGDQPADGSLVMLLSPFGDSGHLSIWTSGLQDRGLLISTSGAIGGIVRMGQFLGGNAMRPIADDLIRDGKVPRAALGVLIAQAQTPDGHRAMFIEQVVEHSPAAAAGLRPGDFILSLAGAPVGDVPSFAAAIAQRDGATDLQVLHEGQIVTVTAMLKPR